MPVTKKRLARRITEGGRTTQPGVTSHNVRSGPQSGPHPHGGADPHPRYEENKARREGRLTPGMPRARGRPAGSKNKPKSLVPMSLVEEILQDVEGIPDEYAKHLKSVLQDGKAISTKQQLDVLLVLLSKSLLPAVVAEGKNNEEVDEEGHKKQPTFKREITDRLKVYNSLLALRNSIEKQEQDDDEEPALVKLWVSRGLAQSGRLALLVGNESGNLGGNLNGDERETHTVGPASIESPQRPLALPSGEQGEADRDIDNDISGSDS